MEEVNNLFLWHTLWLFRFLVTSLEIFPPTRKIAFLLLSFALQGRARARGVSLRRWSARVSHRDTASSVDDGARETRVEGKRGVRCVAREASSRQMCAGQPVSSKRQPGQWAARDQAAVRQWLI